MERQIRPLAFVFLTIDHRVLDGVQINAWLGHFMALQLKCCLSVEAFLVAAALFGYRKRSGAGSR